MKGSEDNDADQQISLHNYSYDNLVSPCRIAPVLHRNVFDGEPHFVKTNFKSAKRKLNLYSACAASK